MRRHDDPQARSRRLVFLYSYMEGQLPNSNLAVWFLNLKTQLPATYPPHPALAAVFLTGRTVRAAYISPAISTIILRKGVLSLAGLWALLEAEASL